MVEDLLARDFLYRVMRDARIEAVSENTDAALEEHVVHGDVLSIDCTARAARPVVV